MSRPAFYDKHPELWALRHIVKWLPCLGDPERGYLIGLLHSQMGKSPQPLPGGKASKP